MRSRGLAKRAQQLTHRSALRSQFRQPQYTPWLPPCPAKQSRRPAGCPLRSIRASTCLGLRGVEPEASPRRASASFPSPTSPTRYIERTMSRAFSEQTRSSLCTHQHELLSLLIAQSTKDGRLSLVDGVSRHFSRMIYPEHLRQTLPVCRRERRRLPNGIRAACGIGCAGCSIDGRRGQRGGQPPTCCG